MQSDCMAIFLFVILVLTLGRRSLHLPLLRHLCKGYPALLLPSDFHTFTRHHRVCLYTMITSPYSVATQAARHMNTGIRHDCSTKVPVSLTVDWSTCSSYQCIQAHSHLRSFGVRLIVTKVECVYEIQASASIYTLRLPWVKHVSHTALLFCL